MGDTAWTECFEPAEFKPVEWTHCCGGYGCSHCRPEEYLEQLEEEKLVHKNNKMRFVFMYITGRTKNA